MEALEVRVCALVERCVRRRRPWRLLEERLEVLVVEEVRVVRCRALLEERVLGRIAGNREVQPREGRVLEGLEFPSVPQRLLDRRQ